MVAVTRDDQVVTAFNIDGDTLWTYDAPSRVVIARIEPTLDDDTEVEVLVATQAGDAEPARIIGIEDDGEEIFSIALGPTDTDNPFSTDTNYAVTSTELVNIDDDANMELLAVVAHSEGLAHQLVSINEDELESSYWHPGPISALMVSELDDRERTILELRLLQERPWTLATIGKTLGITREGLHKPLARFGMNE